MKIYGVPICEATTLGGKHGGESDMDLAGVGEFGVARGLRQTRKHRLPPCCDGGAGKVPWEVRVGPRTSAGTRERKSLCPTQTVNTNQTYTHTHSRTRAEAELPAAPGPGSPLLLQIHTQGQRAFSPKKWTHLNQPNDRGNFSLI